MKFFFASLSAVLAALATVVIEVVALAIPIILLWMVQFNFEGSIQILFLAASSLWMLGHGVPVRYEIGADFMSALGATEQGITLDFSLAPTAIAVFTVLSAVGAGRRAARTPSLRYVLLTASLAGFALAAAGMYFLAEPTVVPSATLAILQTVALYAVALLIAFGIFSLRKRKTRETVAALCTKYLTCPKELFPWILPAIRLAAATLCALTVCACLAFTLATVLRYQNVLMIAQSLSLDLLGVHILFYGQALFFPSLLLASLAWISGAGFTTGAGSLFTPFFSHPNEVPLIPVFGLIPDATPAFALFFPALIVFSCAILGAIFARKHLPIMGSHHWFFLAAVLIATACALAVSLISLYVHGSFGLHAFTDVGIRPFSLFLPLTFEIALGLLSGFYFGLVFGEHTAFTRLTASLTKLNKRIPQRKEKEWKKLGETEEYERDFQDRLALRTISEKDTPWQSEKDNTL